MENNQLFENKELIEKKKTLEKLFYEIGNQQYDFELASLSKNQNGETVSKTKWLKFSQLVFDLQDKKNSNIFKNINCRQILPIEIVIDLENKETIGWCLRILDKYNFYYDCFDTGSRGYHIHLFFNNIIIEEEKEKFIEVFGGDILKKSKKNVIAIEYIMHWKTGIKKNLFQQKEGINDHDKLRYFFDNYIPEENLSILENSSLFNLITEDEFDKKIVGELETRKVIFLCAAGGRLVINSQLASFNLLVNDDAGTGKDYIVANTLSILPKNCYVHKTRISPTVFTYWHNSEVEPDWTWNGKVFYPEDISEPVLNSDVFKVMCSNGSSATIVIKQKAIDIDIEGKPVLITTTASATPNPELTRRFVILSLNSSEDQTKAIMKKHAEYKKKGIVPEYNPIYTESMKYLKRVKVKIPYADLIDKHFPSKNIIMRTHFPRFLDFISASAAFYQFQRIADNEDFILASSEDYDLARICFLRLCSNKYMIPLTINQKKILEMFEKNPELKEPVSKLLPKMQGVIKTIVSMQSNLRTLVKYGLLEEGVTKDIWNRDMEVFSLSNSYTPVDNLNLPIYDKLIEIPKVPIIPDSVKLPIIPNTPIAPKAFTIINEDSLGSFGVSSKIYREKDKHD